MPLPERTCHVAQESVVSRRVLQSLPGNGHDSYSGFSYPRASDGRSTGLKEGQATETCARSHLYQLLAVSSWESPLTSRDSVSSSTAQ